MPLTIALIAAAILAFALFSRWILDNPRGDVESGLAWRAAQLYSILIHRLEVRGTLPPKSLRNTILVANHTAGLDPILLQAASRCFVRFVMAKDMRAPSLEWAWNFTQVIFVDRQSGGGDGLREAIAHLKAGGVLGLFPEGRIERPPRALLPFGPGIGLIIRRTSATIIPVWIQDTPVSPTAWGSLTKRSRSIITFGEPISYEGTPQGTKLTADQIAQDLRARFAAWTTWPLNDAAQAPSHPQPD
jgi:1-acyl-sn-glycerol-3-phosphate acyltransferase